MRRHMYARKKKASQDYSYRDGEVIHPQLLVWVYRLLFRMGAYKTAITEREFRDDALGRMLGFGQIIDGSEGAAAFDRDQIIAQLRAQWKKVEDAYAASPSRTSECEAFHRLGSQLGLTAVQCDVVAFKLSCNNPSVLGLINGLGPGTIDNYVRCLSVCLNYRDEEIRHALRPSNQLVDSGIVFIKPGGSWLPADTLDILSCIEEEICFDHADPLMYFRSRVHRSTPPRLTEDDYSHLSDDIALLKQYMAATVQQPTKGVNVLIHGAPGTGKSELVRLLASILNMKLFEVAVSNRDGRVLDGDDRFRAFMLSQKLLAHNQNSLILFDEIEDVFRESDRGEKSGANQAQRKAWVNRLLENNLTPSFWITNNLRVIDHAFLRRFDYVLEVAAPPRRIRSRVLDKYLADLPVSDFWKKKMAEHDGLVPALVERAAKVVLPMKGDMKQHDMEQLLSRVLGNTLEAMGLSREPLNRVDPGTYRLDVLNADCDMEQVKVGLSAHGAGRICLYGPPGTGKSAFGRYLADALDRPLLVKRASDIVSPWLGMTEKNMARMFRQAKEDNAVLLLDEADSFLQDRQGAQRSWEVTEVNEMLTQMENFEGIFIASTNLMSSLDMAALRRFDLKIRLDYLRTEQAWAMFTDTRRLLNIHDDADLRAPLAHLDYLVPGDFANVVRQARLRPINSSMALLQRLRAECEMKPEGKRRAIGFAA